MDTYEFAASPGKKRTWIVNGSFTLTHKERDVLLNPREWLLDTIINVSSMLLKEGSGMHGSNISIRYPTRRVCLDSA